MSIISKAIKKVKGGVKKIGKALDRRFIEPSRRVNRMRNEQLLEMKRKAEAGEFN